ncbi:MAG: hypothetical protein JXQ29_07315 [Planctomycetes bacterium]|nr:hypothetical protein [Planctomycetota bacterium]
MRRWPLAGLLYAAAVVFLVLRTPVRDALEVAVQAAVAALRHPCAEAARRDAALPAPPPAVAAFLERAWNRAGPDGCARVVAVRLAGDRAHVVVDRGRRDGVALGDVAGFREPQGGPICLAGEVDAVAAGFARIRTVVDAEAWWLGCAGSGRMVLTGSRRGGGLEIEDPENRSALRAEIERGAVVTTAIDRDVVREVPAGLPVGRLKAGGAEGGGSCVEPFFEPRRVLGLRLQRGERIHRFGPRGEGSGDWRPARVVRSWDASPLRGSVLIVCEGGGPVPPDAPVASGAYLEGWVHTAAGRVARVRLVEDPGFYCHVLILRPAEPGRLESPGGAVFRGGRRDGTRVHGGCLEARVAPEAGDLLVVGPDRGAGGVGLVLGEVVSSSAGGFVVLERPARPARGAGLQVGRFARPPRDLAWPLDDAR